MSDNVLNGAAIAGGTGFLLSRGYMTRLDIINQSVNRTGELVLHSTLGKDGARILVQAIMQSLREDQRSVQKNINILQQFKRDFEGVAQGRSAFTERHIALLEQYDQKLDLMYSKLQEGNMRLKYPYSFWYKNNKPFDAFSRLWKTLFSHEDVSAYADLSQVRSEIKAVLRAPKLTLLTQMNTAQDNLASRFKYAAGLLGDSQNSTLTRLRDGQKLYRDVHAGLGTFAPIKQYMMAQSLGRVAGAIALLSATVLGISRLVQDSRLTGK